ncbi:MAG: hypothetical protein Q4D96_04710 [Propionibacteriaceae bacterium]|nr:hypothetical protein [Propionibacteriaceae bacterium]
MRYLKSPRDGVAGIVRFASFGSAMPSAAMRSRWVRSQASRVLERVTPRPASASLTGPPTPTRASRRCSESISGCWERRCSSSARMLISRNHFMARVYLLILVASSGR